MCTLGLSGCRVKPRRPHQTGPAGLAHDSPRTPNVHISGPRRFKHHQNSTKGPQERERRKKIVAEEGKKARNSGPPPPPFGAPLFLWATLQGATLRGPHMSSQNSTSKKAGRSRNWPEIDRAQEQWHEGISLLPSLVLVDVVTCSGRVLHL